MSPVSTEEREGALWIILERKPLNVLDLSTIRSIHSAVAAVASRQDVRAIVLLSGLDGTFSAGSDVADHTRERAPEMLAAFHALIRQLEDAPQCSVAAVDGRCLGGGCELALFCDVVLATPRSTFGQPEIDLACFPPVAAAWLTRLAPRAAFEMVLGGAPVSAAAAAAAGLITRVVDDLDAAVSEWLARLAGKSAAALALARRALRLGASGTFDEALARLEALYVAEVLPTHDAAEGVAAFLGKRRPSWRNE